MPEINEPIPWQTLVTTLRAYRIMRIIRSDSAMGFRERRKAAQLDDLMNTAADSSRPDYVKKMAEAWAALQRYCLDYAVPYLQKYGMPPTSETN